MPEVAELVQFPILFQGFTQFKAARVTVLSSRHHIGYCLIAF